MARCIDCDETWTGHSICHCSGCCRTFTGLTAFDRHQRRVDGRIVCLDPATVTTGDPPKPAFDLKAKGRWGLPGGWYPPSEAPTGTGGADNESEAPRER